MNCLCFLSLWHSIAWHILLPFFSTSSSTFSTSLYLCLCPIPCSMHWCIASTFGGNLGFFTLLTGPSLCTSVFRSAVSKSVFCLTRICWWPCGRVPDLQSGGCRLESRPELRRTKVYSAFHPSGVGKWVPVIAGEAKAGMAHSDCGWTCGCNGKTVRSLENTCHTWALLRWWFITKRHYIKCMHLYLSRFCYWSKGGDNLRSGV